MCENVILTIRGKGQGGSEDGINSPVLVLEFPRTAWVPWDSSNESFPHFPQFLSLAQEDYKLTAILA